MAASVLDAHEMARRIAALQQQIDVKQKQHMEDLLELDATDRANFRSYWQARLAMAQSHLAALGAEVRL